MARKTFDIQKLKDIVNKRNALSTCEPKVREGWNSLLEEVLHQNGTYNGFCYLTEVPSGCKPGIDYANRFKDTDDTRRKYF